MNRITEEYDMKEYRKRFLETSITNNLIFVNMSGSDCGASDGLHQLARTIRRTLRGRRPNIQQPRRKNFFI